MAVGKFVVKNRPGSCGRRTVCESKDCSACPTSCSHAEAVAGECGATIRVGMARCHGKEDNCTSNAVCGVISGENQDEYTVACSPPLKGRFAQLVLPGNRTLNLQEVSAGVWKTRPNVLPIFAKLTILNPRFSVLSEARAPFATMQSLAWEQCNDEGACLVSVHDV